VGLPERAIEGGQEQPTRPLPQVTPFGAGEQGQGAAAAAGGGGVPVLALVVVALLTVAFAGVFAGAAVLVLRRR